MAASNKMKDMTKRSWATLRTAKGKLWSLRVCGLLFAFLGCLFAIMALAWTQWLSADLSQVLGVPNTNLAIDSAESFINSQVDWAAFQSFVPDAASFLDVMWTGSERLVWTQFNLSAAIQSQEFTWNDFQRMWNSFDPTSLPSQPQSDVLQITGSSNISEVNWESARARGVTLSMATTILKQYTTTIKAGFTAPEVRDYLAATWAASRAFVDYESLKPFMLMSTLMDRLTASSWRAILPVVKDANAVLAIVAPYLLDKARTYMQLLATTTHRMMYGITRAEHTLSVVSTTGSDLRISYRHDQPYGSEKSGHWPNRRWYSTAVLLGFGIVFGVVGALLLPWSWLSRTPQRPLLMGTWGLLISAFWVLISIASFPIGFNNLYSPCILADNGKLRDLLVEILVDSGTRREVASSDLENMKCSAFLVDAWPVCLSSEGPYRLGQCTLKGGSVLLFFSCVFLLVAAGLTLYLWHMAKQAKRMKMFVGAAHGAPAKKSMSFSSAKLGRNESSDSLHVLKKSTGYEDAGVEKRGDSQASMAKLDTLRSADSAWSDSTGDGHAAYAPGMNDEELGGPDRSGAPTYEHDTESTAVVSEQV